MKKRKMTPEQIRKATPATEKWVQAALKRTGLPGLWSEANEYAYTLRCFELRFPRIAGFVIPLFAKQIAPPWWQSTTIYWRTVGASPHDKKAT